METIEESPKTKNKTDPVFLERNRAYYKKIKEVKQNCPICGSCVIAKFYKQHCNTGKHQLAEYKLKDASL